MSAIQADLAQLRKIAADLCETAELVDRLTARKLRGNCERCRQALEYHAVTIEQLAHDLESFA